MPTQSETSTGDTPRGWTFGSNLEWVMTRQRVRKSDLARRLDISSAAVSQWVQDKTRPSHERIAQIAAALDVQVMELLGPELTGEERGPGSPETVDLPEFGMDWAMTQDTQGENVFVLDDRKARLGRWRIPLDIIRSNASTTPRPVVMRVQGNAMAPEIAAGDFVLVDLNWRDVSPPGIYLLGEPLRLSFRRCERLFGDKKGLIRISSAQGWSDIEIPAEELEKDILGRVIFKLMNPL